MVPSLVAPDDLRDVCWAGEGGAVAVVASVAGVHEVVETVVAAVRPRDEIVDLAAAPSRGGSALVGGPFDNDRAGAAWVFAAVNATSARLSAPARGTPGAHIPAGMIGATLAGATSHASGKIIFRVFGPDSSPPTDCATGGTTVGTPGVSGNGGYHPSAGFTPTTAGDYWWYASYDGDAHNPASHSRCGAGMVSTMVSPAPPSASITTPANGATYGQGQVVNSSFSCKEGAGGPGVKSCLDQNGNPSRAALDTSTTGQHTFTVTATSRDGLTGTASVTYTVSPPGPVASSGCQDPTGAYDQGFDAGFTAGFDSGFHSGFHSGFQSGFTDGFGSTARHAPAHSSAVAGARNATAAQATYPACNPQFNQGFTTAFNVGFNSGFQKGFNSGFAAEFTAGFNDGYRATQHR